MQKNKKIFALLCAVLLLSLFPTSAHAATTLNLGVTTIPAPHTDTRHGDYFDHEIYVPRKGRFVFALSLMGQPEMGPIHNRLDMVDANGNVVQVIGAMVGPIMRDYPYYRYYPVSGVADLEPGNHILRLTIICDENNPQSVNVSAIRVEGSAPFDPADMEQWDVEIEDEPPWTPPPVPSPSLFTDDGVNVLMSVVLGVCAVIVVGGIVVIWKRG